MINKSKAKIGELHPNEIVRFKDGHKFFGLRHSALSEKIKSGEIPTPMDLSGNGRAMGWTGAQIIEHQRRRLEAAAQRAAKRVAKRAKAEA